MEIAKAGLQEKEFMRESPEYLRTSMAAAITLGFRPGRFYRDAKLPCINLLMTYSEGCMANCAYCGLSRGRSGEFDQKSFIRVDWPVYGLDEIITRIEERMDRIKRICVSMITNPRAKRDLITIVERIKVHLDIPLSLLITSTILEGKDLVKFKEVGANMIGVAVDAATPELFEKHRGRGVRGPHMWETYWEVFRKAVEIFGLRRVGVHLIVGLGETEKEMTATIQRVHDLGGSTHLFSFYPEAGSRLENQSPPPMGQYRRIQLARYLIDEDIATFEDFIFDQEEGLKDFGISEDSLMDIIDTAFPFMTSGCPSEDGEVACNRPYGNELPGPEIRNYPFRLEREDIERVKMELWK